MRTASMFLVCTALAGQAPWVHSQDAAEGPSLTAGEVNTIQIEGPMSGDTIRYAIYLPPDYHTSGVRYPVAYHLHGLGGDGDYFATYSPWDNAARNGDALESVAIRMAVGSLGEFNEKYRDFLEAMYITAVYVQTECGHDLACLVEEQWKNDYAFIAQNLGKDSDPQDAVPIKIFDGERKLIIVNGDSTSFGWWKILQRKMTSYFDGERLVEVRAAVQNDIAIGGWINVESGEPLAPWTKRVTPLLQSKGRRPAIVLAQHSLRGLYGEAEEAIRGEDDGDRIVQGADALEAFAQGMLADGAVFIATPIYNEPMEPATSNERLALEVFMERGLDGAYEGPDLWTPTRDHHPAAYIIDRIHPSNIVGDELIAQL